MSDIWRDNIIPIKTNVVAAVHNRSLGLKGWNSRQGPLYQYGDRTIVTRTLENEKFQLPPRTRTTFITAFSPKNRLLASCHGDHNTHILDVKTKKHLKSLSGHERSPWCVAFHPGIPDILATGSLNGEVRVWDLRADASESYIVDQEENVAIASLSFHPYDHVIAIAAGNEIHFWDWSLPKPFASVKTNNPEIEKVRLVRFDPWGHSIITGIANPEEDDYDDPTFDHWSWLFGPSPRSRRPGAGESRFQTRRRMRRSGQETEHSPTERTRGLDTPRNPDYRRPRRSLSRASCIPRPTPSLAELSLENIDSDAAARGDTRQRSNLSETHQRILHARVSVNAEIRQQYTRLQMLRQERQRLEMRLRELQHSANEVRNSTPLLLNPPANPIEPGEVNVDVPMPVGAPYERSIDSSVRESERLLGTLRNEFDDNQRSVSDPMAMDTTISSPQTYTELNNIPASESFPELQLNWLRTGPPLSTIESYSQPRIAPYVSFPRTFESYSSLSPEDPPLSLLERRERISDRFHRLRQNLLRNFSPRSSPAIASQTQSNRTEIMNVSDSRTGVSTSTDSLISSYVSSSRGTSSVTSSSVRSISDSLNPRVDSGTGRREQRYNEPPGSSRPGRSEDLARLFNRAQGLGEIHSRTSQRNDDTISTFSGSAGGTFPTQGGGVDTVLVPNSDEIIEIDIPDVQSSVTLDTAADGERYIDFESSVQRNDLEQHFTWTSSSNTQVPDGENRHLLQQASTSSNSLRAIPTSCTRTESVNTSVSQLGPDTTSEHESLRMLSRANLIRRVEPRQNQFTPVSSSNNSTALPGPSLQVEPRRNQLGLVRSTSNSPPLVSWLPGPSFHSEVFNRPPTPPISPASVEFTSLLSSTLTSPSPAPDHDFAHYFSNPASLVSTAPPSVSTSSLNQSGSRPSQIQTISAEQRLQNLRESESPAPMLMAATDDSESTSSHSSTRNQSPVAMEVNSEQSSAGILRNLAMRSSADLGRPSQTQRNADLSLSRAQSLSEAVDSLIQATDSLTEAADTLLREATTSASNLIAEELNQGLNGRPRSPGVEEPASQASATRPISSILPSYSPYVGSFQSGNNDVPRYRSSLDSSQTLGALHYGRNAVRTPSQFEQRTPLSTESTIAPILSRPISTSSRSIRPNDTSWRSIPLRRRGLHHRELHSALSSRSRGTARRRDSDSDSEDENLPRRGADNTNFGRSGEARGSISSHPRMSQRIRNEMLPSAGVRSNQRWRSHRNLRRTRNVMRTSINRIISTVYAENNGHQAVVLNIDSASYRLQHWDFTRLKLPEISRTDINVIVPHCKIFNDASVDISRDGRLIAALLPTFVGFPDNMMNVAVLSLQPKNFGQLLFKKSYGPNAVCLSISPLCNYICVGLKSRQFLLGDARPNRLLMAQVLEMTEDKYYGGEMPVVRNVRHPAREQQGRPVSINTVAWSPEVGGGLVYGTNNGDVRMCSITSKDRDNDDSDDNEMVS